MKMFSIWLRVMVVAIFAFASSAHALTRELKMEKSKVKFDLPDGWSALENFAGMPYALSGPEKNRQRPMVGLFMAADDSNAPAFGVVQGKQAAFESARRAWLAQEGGEALEFYPYRKLKDAHSDVYTVGYHYKMKGRDFFESAYYVKCGKKVLYMQSLVPGESFKTADQALDKVARSVACE